MTDTSSTTPNTPSQKSPRGLLYGIGAIVLIGLGVSAYLLKNPAEAPPPPPAEAPVAAPAAEAAKAPADATTTTANPDLTVDDSGLSKAVTTIETEKGTIKFRFYSKDAPNTVARISYLIRSGFYNGLVFHRVVPDFVVQGGSPGGDGTGGSGQNINAEFNSRKHVEGAVGLARASDPNSGDSQFYISLGALPSLDGNYTVFGQVIEGMDVVRKIVVGDKMTKVSVQ